MVRLLINANIYIFLAMHYPEIANLKLNRLSRTIIFTGAGISAESGISTFRDIDGLWAKYDPTELASPQGFQRDPDLVISWYQMRLGQIQATTPNAGHLSITQIQKLFEVSHVITQNVDGFHQDAGNHSVLELHGSIHRTKCFECGTPLTALNPNVSPEVCSCGGRARPDVVWFGENLPGEVIDQAFLHAEQADLCLVIGTSSLVYPAAQLPYRVLESGGQVVEVNPERTSLSAQASISIRGKAAEVLPCIYEDLYALLNSH